jgi:hypothetical protein
VRFHSGVCHDSKRLHESALFVRSLLPNKEYDIPKTFRHAGRPRQIECFLKVCKNDHGLMAGQPWDLRDQDPVVPNMFRRVALASANASYRTHRLLRAGVHFSPSQMRVSLEMLLEKYISVIITRTSRPFRVLSFAIRCNVGA